VGIDHDTMASMFDGALCDGLWQSEFSGDEGPLYHCKVFAIDVEVDGRSSLLIGSTLERDGKRPFLKLLGEGSLLPSLSASQKATSAYTWAIRDALSPRKDYRNWLFAVHAATFRMRDEARAILCERDADAGNTG